MKFDPAYSHSDVAAFATPLACRHVSKLKILDSCCFMIFMDERINSKRDEACY